MYRSARWARSQLSRTAGALALVAFGVATSAQAQQPVDRLQDRGEGVRLSQFGTSIRSGEFLVYAFYEYYRDHDYEYKPSELGFLGDVDFRGRYRANEGLLFMAYGLSDRVAVEFEVATISASLRKSADDRSALPPTLSEAGLGDVESSLRWRWNRESERRPEFFSFFNVVFPFQRHRALIGTRSWEYSLGAGLVRGYRWGTVTARAAIGYSEGAPEPGEYAIEYLKRLSRHVRVYAGIEGTQDEAELIGEAQIFLTPNVFVKLNNAVGLTSKAPDWAPEVGLVFSFPRR
jgi:hypothetical protein